MLPQGSEHKPVYHLPVTSSANFPENNISWTHDWYKNTHAVSSVGKSFFGSQFIKKSAPHPPLRIEELGLDIHQPTHTFETGSTFGQNQLGSLTPLPQTAGSPPPNL